jgi:hypothetical protein
MSRSRKLKPNKETLEAMQDVEEKRNLIYYENAEAMFKDLNEETELWDKATDEDITKADSMI